MELYHQTLLRPVQVQHALAAHLLPIKPREELEKPKQLLIAKTCSLQLFTYNPVKMGQQKYDFKSFCKEDIFSNICAVETVEYADEDMKKDLILLSLINGKYQLFQWMPQSSRLSLRDQSYIFSNESEVESGLCKPVPGHYISVNNEMKLVMIANASWEFKIYQQTLGYAGVRLEPLLYFQQPLANPSICLQLASGNAENIFYSLRTYLNEGKKTAKVHRISKRDKLFEEDTILLEDPSAHMLIVRQGNSFIAIGKQYLTYYNKNTCNLIKLPQIRQYLQSCYFRRIRQKKEELFIVNQHGQLLIIIVDQSKPKGCVASSIEKIFAVNHVVTLQKNLFFGVSANEDNFLFQFHQSYKPDEKGRIMKGKEQSREELMNPKYPNNFREIEILGSIPCSRMIRDMKLINLEKSVSSQIIITGGRPGNKKGFLSVLRYGLKVKQYLTVNFMNPVGAWCLKRSIADKQHSYIVFTFSNRKTSSYSFQNNMLTHTNELKLEESEITLHVNKLCDGSIVQVTASKIRHIQKENTCRDINIKGRIMKAMCVTEGKQLFILLVGGFMEYYELNTYGQLKMLNDFNLDSEANFIDYAPPDYTEGRPVSRLIVIGKTNYNISIFTLEGKILEQKRTKNMKCMIESLTLLNVDDQYQIVVGTNTGKMIKFMINRKGEDLTEPEEVIVCEKTVKFTKISVMNKLNLIRICPQPTLSYSWQGQEQQCTLPLPNIDFITQIVVEGAEKSCMFLTYYDNYLRFIEISGFGNLLQQYDKEIQLTGRKIIVCGDRLGVLSESKDKKQDKQTWKSIFCLFNPTKNYSLEKYQQFDTNQKCLSMCYIPRDAGKGYICFGCVTDYQTYPSLRAQKPSIKVYSYEKEKDTLLTLLYTYAIEDIPTAMEVYLDKLLVGVGKKLILFEIYPSKLLMKAVRPSISSYLNSIAVQGQKIITSQIFNSFSVYRLNPADKSFDYIGQDILPRFISTSYILDGNYGVIAGGDKFGNFFISKFSQKIKTQFQSGGQSRYNEFTDCNKLESMVIYNLGQVITSIQSGRLDERKPQSIFYSSIDGRVGMFYPFESEELKQLNLLTRLQQELKNSTLSSASNHENFRSFYNPSKGVIDGDFCKLFENLTQIEKEKIGVALQTDPKDISLLLLSMQNKFK